ncbi:MAG: hypothetical protein QOK10_3058 [Pseudonocardiales bacterium]|nr:hypothetical protein [Pseudonocardiales bacterium]
MQSPSRTAPAAELATSALCPLDEVDTSRPPWPGEFHTISGTEIFVRVTPSTDPAAQPALYVHGLGGASTNFTDLAALLSPYLAAHALDLPGFGRSGPPPGGDYSIAAHARIVIRYLERSGRGAVHLVGNSMGGAVSIEVAAQRPDLVRSLTLISPAVPDLRPHKGGDYLLPFLLLPGVGIRALQRLDRASPERRAKAVIDLCFAHPDRVPANRLAEAAADILARRELSWAHDAMLSSLRGIVRMYLARGPRSAWRLMAGISVPSLVLWGTEDKLVAASNAPRVAATLRDATLLVLPDIGHTAQLEDPVTTARAILGLMARANDGRRPLGVGV